MTIGNVDLIIKLLPLKGFEWEQIKPHLKKDIKYWQSTTTGAYQYRRIRLFAGCAI